MKIRQAKPQDVRAVQNIIDNFQVPQNWQSWLKAEYGFFNHSMSRADLLKSLNPYFIVAEQRGYVDGFCLAYSGDFSHANKVSFSEARFFLEEFGRDFLYIYMFGIRNPDSFKGRRIAGLLALKIRDLARDNGLKRIVIGVAEEPWKNQRAERFAKKHGFKRFGEIKRYRANPPSVIEFYRLGL
jgi:ribosomal protein S18 acetylase RimI-like enzyme